MDQKWPRQPNQRDQKSDVPLHHHNPHPPPPLPFPPSTRQNFAKIGGVVWEILPSEVKYFDWNIAKSSVFGLVEIVRFVPNSPPQTYKIVKLRHFYVFVTQKNANVTSFCKIILRKTLKIEFYST
jgi:hypothetical protein